MSVKLPKPKSTPMVSTTPKPSNPWAEQLFGKQKEETRSVYDRATDTKGNWVSNSDVAAPYKAWRKATVNPAGSAMAAAAIAGAGAYYAAPWLLKKFRGINRKLPKSMQQPIKDDEIKTSRNRMVLLAALGVGGLSLASNFDAKYPGASMMKWNYAPKAGVSKQASFGGFSNDAVMSQDIIPLDHAKELIANDKFLTSNQKAAIGTIFDNTPDQQGTASMADITSGAIRSGLGFAKGAVAGYALGKIFALPASVTRVASITGGLANAFRTSGLIS